MSNQGSASEGVSGSLAGVHPYFPRRRVVRRATIVGQKPAQPLQSSHLNEPYRKDSQIYEAG
jgi:hypothetical protein